MSIFSRKKDEVKHAVEIYNNNSPENLINVNIQKVHRDAIIPTYAHDDDACCDLYAVEDYTLKKGGKGLLRTGVAIEIPTGYEVQVRPRSGLAFKQGFTVLNAPGTVDAQYRNEIMVLGINLGDSLITIRKGDRIAQMCIKPVYKMQFTEVTQLSDSNRGLGGWGSTGK
jgi:dUTP pyrophosphatase